MNKNTCAHLNVTEFITNRYMATLEEPGEDVGYSECNDCGEKFDFGEYPEDAKVKQDYSLMGDYDEPDYPLPVYYPEL